MTEVNLHIDPYNKGLFCIVKDSAAIELTESELAKLVNKICGIFQWQTMTNQDYQACLQLIDAEKQRVAIQKAGMAMPQALPQQRTEPIPTQQDQDTELMSEGADNPEQLDQDGAELTPRPPTPTQERAQKRVNAADIVLREIQDSRRPKTVFPNVKPQRDQL